MWVDCRHRWESLMALVERDVVETVLDVLE